jgi:peptidyl-prolyl cis-trans isomerase C
MFTPRSSAAVALTMLVVFNAACRKPPAADNKPAAEAAKAPATPGAPESIKPVPETLPEVLARVDGESVTRADFEKYITQMEANAGQPVPKEQRNEIYRKALDQLVTIKLLTREAKSRAIKADDKAVDDQMQKIRSQFPSEDEYKKALASRGVTPERLREDMLTESRINVMMDAEAAGGPAVTDAEIRDFYEKNPERFKQPEGVRASHILLRVQPGDEAGKKKARAAIESILKQAKAGKDFGDLARKHSNDGSAQSGGDLGFFTKDRMVPEFANAAFALKPGQISDVVETQFGYHIIKLTERRPAADVPLQDVTEQVREFLTQKRHQEKAEAFVKVLRSKSKVEVLI